MNNPVNNKSPVWFVARLAMLVVGAVFTAVSFAGATIITASGSTPYTVSNTDLLQAPGTTATWDGNTNTWGTFSTSSSLSTLTDGQFGTTGAAGRADALFLAADSVDLPNPAHLTYTFDTSHNSGYAITSIATYTGWSDNGRIDQDYTVSYSTVSAPNTFINLATVAFNPTDDNTSVVITQGGAETMPTGVKSIQFTLANQQNGYVGWREFDVTGFAMIPEPSLVVLLGLGGLLLFGRRSARGGGQGRA